MPTFIDLTGRVFGRLTVISCAGREGHAHIRWNCHCACGAEVSVARPALMNKDTRSCGCLRLETNMKRLTKHGAAGKRQHTPTYEIWVTMRARCSNPKSKDWMSYGARGITVAERWQNFANFLADMGEKPKGKSIERVDNDADYSPENCIWADNRTQQRNKRATRFVTICGKRQPIIAACEGYGVAYRRVWRRQRKTGATMIEAFFDVLDGELHPRRPIAGS